MIYIKLRQMFLNPKVADVGEINFGNIDYSGIVNYLTKERNFSQERVETSLNRLKKSLEKKSHTLEQWFN